MSFVLRAANSSRRRPNSPSSVVQTGGEIGRVGEERSPSFSEVAVESDGALSRLGGEVRCGVVQLDGHASPPLLHC
jgi:hypothetical protein